MDTSWTKGVEIARICTVLSSETAPKERQELVDLLVQLTKCIKACRLIGEKLNYDILVKALRPLVAHQFDWVVRGVALRTLRYLTIDGQAIKVIHQNRVHLFLIRSLEREHKLVWERMQALNLIRQMMMVNAELISRCILKSIIAVAGNKIDPLRVACIETLRELSLTATRAVSETGGIRTIVNSILDPLMSQLAEPLIMTLVFLINSPAKRGFLTPSLDIIALLAPLTDTGAADSEDQSKRWDASRRAVVALLKSWAGLVALTSDTHGLRALVQMLVQPVSVRLRVSILQTILEVLVNVTPTRTSSASYEETRLFRAMKESTEFVSVPEDALPPPPLPARLPAPGSKPMEQQQGSTNSSSSATNTVYWGIGPGSMGSAELATTGLQENRMVNHGGSTHSLLDNYMSMVLLAFVSCGLLEALAQLSISARDKELSRMAMHVLSFVMQNVSRYLPENMYRPLLSFPVLLERSIKASESLQGSARTEAQRGVAVVSLLARTVGLGYDNAYATFLTRSTCESGILLASELGLAASGERARLERQAIFPRSGVLMLRTGIPGRISGLDGTNTSVLDEGSTSSLLSPTIAGGQKVKAGRKLWNGIRTLGGKSTGDSSSFSARDENGTLIGRRSNGSTSSKRSTKGNKVGEHGRMQRISSRLDLTTAPRPVKKTTGNRNETRSGSAGTGAVHPHDANRGHRHLVGQLVVTDLAHTRVGEFFRLLNHTRVLVGKDFTKWDWAMIDEVLSGPCQNHDLLVEALKTKFIKRVAGFFRVTTIGEYIALPWTPDHVYYTNVATNLIRTLLDSPEGVTFLRSDRRGKIAIQLVAALDLELSAYGDDLARSAFGVEGYVGFGGIGSTSPHPEHLRTQSSTSHPASRGYGDSSVFDDQIEYIPNPVYEGIETGRIFARANCLTTMVRDVFVLAGVYTSHQTGISILQSLGFFDVLTRLSRRPDKDYITRLVVTHLDYAASRECREWLQLTLLNNRISSRLRLFSIGLLRGLLRSSHTQALEVARWVLELLFSELKFGGKIMESSISVLIEAAHYPSYLEVMVSLGLTPLLRVLDLPQAQPLLLKYLGTEAGLQMLTKNNWADKILKSWHKVGNTQYVFMIEAKLTAELSKRNSQHRETKDRTTTQQYNIRNVAEAVAKGKSGMPNVSGNRATHTKQTPVFHATPFSPNPIPVRAHEASASTSAEPGFQSSDLMSVFRLPWRIEVWAVTAGGEQAKVAMDTCVNCQELRPEQIHEDVSVSTASETTSSRASPSSSARYGLQITAIPQPRQQATDLGSDEIPYWLVPEDSTLYACLSVAGQPVDPQGQLHPKPCGGGGFTVPTRDGHYSSTAEGADSVELDASSGNSRTMGGLLLGRSGRGRNGSSPVSNDGALNQAGQHRKRPMSNVLRYSLGRAAGASRNASSAIDTDELSKLWAAKDSVLPLDDPMWIKVSPTQRYDGVVAVEANQDALNEAEFGRLDEDTVTDVAPSLAFEICPEPNCNASFTFERRSALPGVEPEDAFHGSMSGIGNGVSSVTANGTQGDSVISQQQQQHNYLNPLFSKAATNNGAGFGAGATSIDSEAAMTPNTRAQRMSFTPPTQSIVLLNVSYSLELVPHRSATPSIPTHIYGELVKTDLGISKLSKTGHVKQFVDQACQPGIRTVVRRAALWALGHIGSTARGLDLLLQSRPKVLEMISYLACKDPCPSMRGTALYCLGLLSTSPMGQTHLSRLDWEPLSPGLGQENALVVVPRFPQKFFSLPRSTTPIGVWDGLSHRIEGEFLGNYKKPTQSQQDESDQVAKLKESIRVSISELCNGIAQKDAHSKLKQLRTSSPGLFQDLSLMLDAHEMLARYAYKPSLRQFTMDLFYRRIDFSNPEVWEELDELPMR